MAEEKYQNKTQEAKKLIDFSKANNLFIKEISEKDFISSGAEQKVYIRGKNMCK